MIRFWNFFALNVFDRCRFAIKPFLMLIVAPIFILDALTQLLHVHIRARSFSPHIAITCCLIYGVASWENH